MFYRGTVHSYQAASGLHTIFYDDGQRVKERLAVSFFSHPASARSQCSDREAQWLFSCLIVINCQQLEKYMPAAA